MKISTRGRYALRMMIHIAEKAEGETTTLREISEQQGMSVKYLEQLAAPLAAEGLLQGHRGARGGYSLKRPAKDISAGDIIRASEGSMAPVACLEDEMVVCPRADACETLDFWKGLDTVIEQYLDSANLADLARESLERKKQLGERDIAAELLAGC